jgi:hypothetical protein
MKSHCYTTTKIKVPVRFKKGYFITEERKVRIGNVDKERGIAEVFYETDMFDTGAVIEYSVTVALQDIFRTNDG